jgi:hypothetical protein
MGEFVTSEHDGHRMDQMIIDGELSGLVVKKLAHSFEEQTRVHPISQFRHRSYVTAGDPVQLILCRRIIYSRIFMETCR